MLVARSCPTLRPHGLQPVKLLCLWDSPGKNTGDGCLSLFQGIFTIQGLNPGLRNCKLIPYHLSYQGSQASEGHSQCHTYVQISCQTQCWSHNSAQSICGNWPVCLKTLRYFILSVLHGIPPTNQYLLDTHSSVVSTMKFSTLGFPQGNLVEASNPVIMISFVGPFYACFPQHWASQ